MNFIDFLCISMAMCEPFAPSNVQLLMAQQLDFNNNVSIKTHRQSGKTTIGCYYALYNIAH